MGSKIPFPTLTTPRLTLRGYPRGDAGSLHLILSELDILKYFPRSNPPEVEGVQASIDHQFAQWKDYKLGW